MKKPIMKLRYVKSLFTNLKGRITKCFKAAEHFGDSRKEFKIGIDKIYRNKGEGVVTVYRKSI